MFEEKNWEQEFKTRLEKHYNEMRWLYMELYHNDEQAFDYFLNMLYQYYSERSPLLKDWDQAESWCRTGIREMRCWACSCIPTASRAT
jgi:amylosucrase